MKAGGDEDLLEDTDFLEALNDEFVIEGIDWPDDIENERREVVYTLTQAF